MKATATFSTKVILELTLDEAKMLYIICNLFSHSEYIKPWNTDTEEFANDLMQALYNSGIYEK